MCSSKSMIFFYMTGLESEKIRYVALLYEIAKAGI